MEWIRKNSPVLAVLIIYIVGVAGFLVPALRDQFGALSWSSLLISFIILLYSQSATNLTFWISILIVGATGYFLEVLGVKTGLLFGEYTYGNSLGIKVLDVPLMIGINWILLVYLSSYIARSVFKNKFLIIILAAAMMTGLDFLIEPFAIRFDLWSWEIGHVPMQNYLMWFIISLAMNHLFLVFNPQIKNPVARPLAICLVLFFLLIDLFVIWL